MPARASLQATAAPAAPAPITSTSVRSSVAIRDRWSLGPGSNLSQQPLSGGTVSHDPVGAVAGPRLVDDPLELLARLSVAALLDKTAGQLDAGAREVWVQRERPSEVPFSALDVAAEHPGRLEVERAGQRQPGDVVGIELEDRVDLLPQRGEKERGAKLSLGDRPAAEVRRIPQVRVRAARRQLDGALGDVATALVAGELRLRCHRAVVGPRQVGPRQEDQRLQGRRPRDLALEKVTGVIEPGEALPKVSEERPPQLSRKTRQPPSRS